MSYLCVDDFQYLLFICLYQWAFLIVIFLFLVVAFSFLLRDSLFRIWCKAGLHLTFNSLNFFLSVKFLISPLNGNESLAGSSINYCGFFYHFKYVIPLLYCRRYMKKSADNLVHIPFMLFVTFTLLLLIFFGCKECEILAPRSRIEPTTPALKGKISTTGPPGKSQGRIILDKRKSTAFDRI